MCLPALPLIGLGLLAGGSVMNFIGQKKADSSLNKTFNRERTRQKGLEAEQIGRFEDSLASTKNVTDPAEAAKAAAAREAALSGVTESASPAASGYLPGSSSAPAIVATAAEKAGAASDARTSQLAQALATLGGVNDQMQQNDIRIGRNSQEISQIGGFKRGSLDVLQAEMEAARQKGKTLRMLGGLASTIGGAALSGGLGGIGGGAAAGAGSAGIGTAANAASMGSSLAASIFGRGLTPAAGGI